MLQVKSSISKPAPRLYDPHLDFMARLLLSRPPQPDLLSHHYPPSDKTSYPGVIQAADGGPNTQKTPRGPLQYRQNGFERRRRPARRWRCGTGEPGAAPLSHLSWPSNCPQGARLPLPETRDAVHVQSAGYAPAVL